mmetsp:Transcript_7312/g.14653  ORF Transcript_7312/g.14653 Transcript_7312/m.14653 type:complete len:198 (-) Transcript_7312:768-1361(-)
MSESDRERSRSPARRGDDGDRARSLSPKDERMPENEEDNSFKAFVGGLPWKIEDEDLRDIFADFAPDECVVMKDKFNGKSRGFGFVYFKDEASREDAIAKVHDTEIDGRRISVRAAIPRSEIGPRPRRGRGGPRRDFGRGGYDRRGGYDDRRSYRDSGRRDYYDRRGYDRRDYDRRDYDRRDYDRRDYDRRDRYDGR